MIERLAIQNYALIEQLEIQFSKGLTIITGETGAGKSILLGALGLVMGQRADTKVLYSTDAKCIVEATFQIASYPLQGFFVEHDLDYDPELIVRREISPSGKSRAFVNDSPVNLKILQQLSSALIDLHQQFDTLDINQEDFQLKMIDALANNSKLLSSYQAHFQTFSAKQKECNRLKEQAQQFKQEQDFLQFQIEELEKANLQEGEQAQLEQELNQLNNAEEITRVAGAAHQGLSESDPSIIGQLQDFLNQIQQLQDAHPALPDIEKRLQGQVVELEDLANELGQIAEDTEFLPDRAQEVQERLDLLYRLQNKHQLTSEEELLAHFQSLNQRITDFSKLDEDIDILEREIAYQHQVLEELAQQLRDRRLAVIPDFEAQIMARLRVLAIPNATLSIQLTDGPALNRTGKDEAQFLFAANKGSRLQSIKEVASGGELSRLALAIKSLVAAAIPLPTLLFDEIDSGISGDVALKMGEILELLSDEHQVVTITHSPQVASKAHRHYFVYKKDEAERTVTKVKLLSPDERIRALAVMLSSNPPSASAIENARELLGNR